jgi:Carboxypeptidase regulatory-like domain
MTARVQLFPQALSIRLLSRSRALVTFLAFSMVVQPFVSARSAAQDNKDSKKDAQLRTVYGVTMDKSESPIPSAVVFLKNARTNTIRSSISDDQGNYRFSGLDPNTDYEIHAEKDAAQSATRTISSFDTKKEIVLNLKLDKKKI